ncbi:MAG TPA: hypothetical protein VGS27_11165 [Candidatus Sulfotelmatobacter sp.]|nr:hypothetical protein [Candidatus Sulfotelmatobacter sp.]
MAYKIEFRVHEDFLCFEIAGNISNHIDSLAAYVRHFIVEWRTQKVLLDVRNATGGPSPAKLFIHVLKYPPMHRIDCALIDREPSRDFLVLYAKLMRHRGHRIRLSATVDEGAAWLMQAREPQVAPKKQSLRILQRLRQLILPPGSVNVKA